jgi:hypothetical protein
MEEISYEAFAARLDQPFVLRRHDTPELGEPIAAELIDCSRYLDNGRSTGYNLTFRVALSTPAEQANYLVEADGLTPTPIFLVPARQTPDGVEFHAVFNQLTEDENVL